jgi:hypothetical protein
MEYSYGSRSAGLTATSAAVSDLKARQPHMIGHVQGGQIGLTFGVPPADSYGPVNPRLRQLRAFGGGRSVQVVSDTA